jgi:hypothetical protein
MNYEIKRINIWSVAKVSFVLGGVLGFVLGLFFWMFASMLAQLPLEEFSSMDGMEGLGAMGIMLPFMMAVFYGIGAMLGNAIMAGVYNLLAGLVGGVELTLTQSDQPVYATPPTYVQPPPAPIQPPPTPQPPPPPSAPPPPSPPPVSPQG